MSFFEKLIGAKTYLGDYTEIIKVLKEFISENTNGEIIEQKIEEKKSNLIVKFGNPELIINCHMDTVKPSGEWLNDPNELIDTDLRYYGLGTTDTKGNIYAVLKAVQKIQPKNLMLLFSIDEESGSKTGVEYFLESEYKTGIKKAIVCEPTLLNFVNKHKGYYSFFVEHKAEAGHSSIKSKSAVVKAAENILELDANGFNIGAIEGSNATNVVAEHCKFKASIRTYDSFELVKDKIIKISKDAIIKPSFKGIPLINESPMFAGDFQEVGFWTEAPLFQSRGINAVVFGAGSIEQAHKCNEFIEKEQLEGAIQIFEKILGEEV